MSFLGGQGVKFQDGRLVLTYGDVFLMCKVVNNIQVKLGDMLSIGFHQFLFKEFYLRLQYLHLSHPQKWYHVLFQNRYHRSL